MSFDYMPREREAAVKAVHDFKTSGASIEPRELLLGALAELEKSMCQAVDLHCGWHIRDIESHIVERSVTQEEVQMKLISIEQGDKWFREHGCTICDLGQDGYELTDCADSVTGGSLLFESNECFGKPGAARAGIFHTHPYGLPTPSYRDVMSTFTGNLRINFIGGQIDGEKVIVGYSPRPESYIKWEMKQRIEPYDEFKNADVDKFINFLYRPPWGTSVEEVFIKQFGVYDEDEKMDHFVKDLEYLNTVFDVIVHWC
jgi:hypothetical protein